MGSTERGGHPFLEPAASASAASCSRRSFRQYATASISSWPVMNTRMSPGGYATWMASACFTAPST